jgi:hypothetical protein
MNEILMKAVKELADQYQEIVNLARKYPNDAELGKQVRISIRDYISNKETDKKVESQDKK